MEITVPKIQQLASLWSQPVRFNYELRNLGRGAMTEQERKNALMFIPTNLTFIGIKIPVLKKLASETVKLCKSDEQASFALLNALWADATREGRHVAAEILGSLSSKYPEKCSQFMVERLQHIGDWEICDRLACVSMRKLLKTDFDKYKDLIPKWMGDENLWVRRFGTVCLVTLMLNKHKDDSYIYTNVKKVMADHQYYVKKSAGWVLREATKRYNPDKAYKFMLSYAKSADDNTRWIVRDGSEKLPKAKRDKLLAALKK